MGFLKQAKADHLGTQAQKAWNNGDQYFAPILNLKFFTSGLSGNQPDVTEMMASITAVSWKLHTWAVTQDHNDKPQAWPLFTRQ